MKNLKILLLLLSQALISKVYSQGFFIVEIDTSTGLITKTSTQHITGLTQIYTDAVYDEANHQFIFKGADGPTVRWYSVRASDGSLMNNPVSSGFPGGGPYPAFDNSTGSLYGLDHMIPGQGLRLTAIDRTTAINTYLSTADIPIPTYSSGILATFNEALNRFIVIKGIYYISIDAATGNVVTSAPNGSYPTDYIFSLSYNRKTGNVMGMMQHGDVPGLYVLIRVAEPSWYAVYPYGTFLAGIGTGTIDTALNRYIYTYSNAQKYYIGALSTITGQLVFHHEVPLPASMAISNVHYDNALGKLFAIYTDQTITSIQNTTGETIKIFPIPASHQLRISLGNKQHDVTVKLYNMMGQAVKSAVLDEGNELLIDVSSLSPGAYTAEVHTAKGKTVKNLIVD